MQYPSAVRLLAIDTAITPKIGTWGWQRVCNGGVHGAKR